MQSFNIKQNKFYIILSVERLGDGVENVNRRVIRCKTPPPPPGEGRKCQKAVTVTDPCLYRGLNYPARVESR